MGRLRSLRSTLAARLRRRPGVGDVSLGDCVPVLLAGRVFGADLEGMVQRGGKGEESEEGCCDKGELRVQGCLLRLRRSQRITGVVGSEECYVLIKGKM